MTKPALIDDPNAPLKAGIRYGLIGLAILLVLSLAVWVPFKHAPGLWAVLIGAGVGGGFILMTVVTILVSAKVAPSAAMAVLLISWFVKMVVVLIAMAILSNFDFFHHTAMATTLLLSLVLVLGGELYGVFKTQATYVQPEPSGADEVEYDQ